MGYSFDSSVTEAQAKKAIATSNDVLESQVSLSITGSRRLDSSSTFASLRRLAKTEYDTVISTTDMTKATSVMESSADVGSLTAALKEVAPDAPAPTISAAPAVRVTVRTALVSDTEVAVAPPAATTLNTELSSSLGETVEVDVENAQTTSCNSNGDCSITSLGEGSANGALRLAPLLSVLVAGLVVAFGAA